MKDTIIERIRIFKKIYSYFKPIQSLYFILLLLKTASLVLSLITPVLYMFLINDVMINKDLSKLIWIVIGYICVFVLQTLVITFNKLVHNKTFIKFNLKLRLKLLSKLYKMKTEDYEKYSAGDIKNRIENDVGVFEKFLITHMIGYVFSVISAISIIIIMLRINWVLSVFSLIMIPFSFAFAKFMSKKATLVSNDYREKYGMYETFVHSTVQNWKEVKANNLEEKQVLILEEWWKSLSNLFIKNQIYWYINRAFIAFKDFFVTKMNIYFLGGILIISGRLDVALLLTFMNYYEKLFNDISSISNSIVSFKTDKPIIERVIEILEYEDLRKHSLIGCINEIRLENVCFNYPQNSHTVLNSINITILKNEHVAIVGRSGCGKSTLVKLVLGLYEPTNGEVLFDGMNIQKLRFRHKIGVIMQEPYLFNLSIKENLRFAKRTASEEEMDVVCKKANIYKFVQTLPEKYDTVIGEKGVKLSGGQKQRLAIARALLYDPEIIICDESTSSLDSENEKAIVSTIKHMQKEKTIITIAHRYSSIIGADKVFVMEDGKIVNCGTHSQLKGKNLIYDSLFGKQYDIGGVK